MSPTNRDIVQSDTTYMTKHYLLRRRSGYLDYLAVFTSSDTCVIHTICLFKRTYPQIYTRANSKSWTRDGKDKCCTDSPENVCLSCTVLRG